MLNSAQSFVRQVKDIRGSGQICLSSHFDSGDSAPSATCVARFCGKTYTHIYSHKIVIFSNCFQTTSGIIQQSSNQAQRDGISSTGQIILDFLCRIPNNGNGVGTGNAGTQTVNSIVLVASCGSPDIPSVNTGLSSYR